MESEPKWVYERIKLYELMAIHPNWSSRQYAHSLGHDHRWVQKWKRRIQSATKVSLSIFQSRSRAPKHPPPKICEEAKAVVCQLREELSETFHRPAGPKTILNALDQYRNSRQASFALPRATSSIRKILHERGYISPKKVHLREPLVLPAPMEEWELDFGEIRLSDEEIFEFLIVIDRGTSRLVYLEGGNGHRAETALEAVARLFLLHGLPRRLRFDRDSRLWGAWTRDSYPSPFVRFLRVLGIEPIICPPRRPDKKPMVERGIFTLKNKPRNYPNPP
jgi:hypothetical protein